MLVSRVLSEMQTVQFEECNQTKPNQSCPKEKQSCQNCLASRTYNCNCRTVRHQTVVVPLLFFAFKQQRTFSNI